jgi:hypothetical protein
MLASVRAHTINDNECPCFTMRIECWMQWNAATECNVMLPLSAFPMHYYPATDTMKFCRPMQPNPAT